MNNIIKSSSFTFLCCLCKKRLSTVGCIEKNRPFSSHIFKFRGNFFTHFSIYIPHFSKKLLLHADFIKFLGTKHHFFCYTSHFAELHSVLHHSCNRFLNPLNLLIQHLYINHTFAIKCSCFHCKCAIIAYLFDICKKSVKIHIAFSYRQSF